MPSEPLKAEAAAIIEIRTYRLKPGTHEAFHRAVVERSLPMLERCIEKHTSVVLPAASIR